MSVTDLIALISAVLVFSGLLIAVFQLNGISRSLKLGQQANSSQVIAHFTNKYHEIVAEAHKTNELAVGSWWYRYWDLETQEFNFFKKGLLDPDIFEMWVNELATIYHESPGDAMSTRADSHKTYLATTLPAYRDLHSFYEQLVGIAHMEEHEARAQSVHELILRFSP